MTAALLIVDVQNDFLPGGALAAPRGDEVIPVIASLTPAFPLVFATQDWHPADHGSFAANHPGKEPGDQIDLHGLPQTLWPVHCVQGEMGAQLAEGIDSASIRFISRKGKDPTVDSYSGFFDNGRRAATDLHAALQEAGVDTLYVCGLATEYCVKFTALDAVSLGYRTLVVEDACRGLDELGVQAAWAELEEAGAKRVSSDQVLAELAGN